MMLQLSRVYFLIIFILSAIPDLASAQNAGSPDISFGDNGTVVTQLGDGYDHCAGLIVQPDQKIVIAGRSEIGIQYEATLVRFNADGSYDNTFSNDGVAYSDEKFGSYSNEARPLAIQPDGKLIHVSNTGTFGAYNILVTRFNSDGTLDTGFDSDGSAEISFLSGDDYPNAVVLQPDGKILVAGMGNTSGDFYRMAAARFNPDGSIDNTFNGTGVFILDLEDHDDYIKDAIVLQDGKIMLLCESRFSATEKDLVLIRLQSDGTYDTSFDGDGIVNIAVTTGTDYIGQFARQPDGKYIVAGTVEDGNYFDVFVLRVEEDGSLDNSFGTNGITISHISEWDDWGEAVVIDEDGKILIGGYHSNSAAQLEGALVLRYTPNGNLDPSFGDNGYVHIDASSYHVENIALQADHKILISGWYSSGGANGFEFAVTRLLSEQNVGINDPAENAPLEIFPNPSDGTFSLRIPGDLSLQNEITVLDITGKIIFQATDLKPETLHLDLHAGVYLLKYTSESKTCSERLIISK